MFHERDALYSRQLAYAWIGLSFQAGAVNSGAFLAVNRYVSHITGFATHFGFDLASLDFAEAIAMLSVPIFFVLGSVIAASLIEHQVRLGKVPFWKTAFALIAGILAIVAVLGDRGLFGGFLEPFSHERDYAFLGLLALACGIQNALFSETNVAVIRTTHLTGTSTDLGVGMVRILSQTLDSNHLKKEKRLLRLRTCSIIGFVAGATLGAWAFLNMRYLGFLLPAGSALHFVIWVHFIKTRQLKVG